MKKENEERDLFAQGTLFGCLVTVYILFGISIQAWTLMALWKWYMVPFGLPSLGYFHALGLTILSTYFQKETLATLTTEASKGEDAQAKVFVKGMTIIALTLACLFFGWIIHFFV